MGQLGPRSWAAAFSALVLLGTLVYAQPTTNSNNNDLGAIQILSDPFPYYFPQLGKDAPKLFAMPTCSGVSIEEATIDQLQGYLQKGQLTSEKLVMCYIERTFQVSEYIKYVHCPRAPQSQLLQVPKANLKCRYWR